MADIVIQAGHCHRKTGATGTHREQEFTWAVGTRLRDQLNRFGHRATLIGADDRVPPSKAFIALHTDGSTSRSRRGASVGYPDSRGAVLAAAWKRAHQRHGFPGGFLHDNYTAALRGYYGFGRSSAPIRFLAEHGTTTNAADSPATTTAQEDDVNELVTADDKKLYLSHAFFGARHIPSMEEFWGLVAAGHIQHGQQAKKLTTAQLQPLIALHARVLG